MRFLLIFFEQIGCKCKLYPGGIGLILLVNHKRDRTKCVSETACSSGSWCDFRQENVCMYRQATLFALKQSPVGLSTGGTGHQGRLGAPFHCSANNLQAVFPSYGLSARADDQSAPGLTRS